MEKNKISENTKNVFVSLVGKPNVGKSSILNALVGEKVAIVTSKPQTTRTKITGILTKNTIQYVFLDTPGIHNAKTKLGNRMVKETVGSIADVDIGLMIFEPYGELTEAENNLILDIKKQKLPTIAVINKIDTIKNEQDILDRINLLNEFEIFENIIQTSVVTELGLEKLLNLISEYAMDGPHYFPEDSYTDMPEKALVAEILREKMLLNLHDEIPHGIAITVESFKERPNGKKIDIDINVYCERKSHKGMIIGKNGTMLNKIRTQARAECESFLDIRVDLKCWVKVKEDWRDNDFLLNDFGFNK